ncbi:hypothetical protein EPA93_31265 [Ktedonosporobacter rubrisoli]|uniref:Uncharacterized protein n=1 Tax=Ktedonosporobacter rubrisoli TaxID=2509675 RepID=A0A4P6JWW1_KTERU|nr:Imm51 family immunity protein [Ktedonosporobacter rubrisoli]QBD80218.1 hypothetical protein EPA93_31265 [Ktedonosporobacter rubrisoli]
MREPRSDDDEYKPGHVLHYDDKWMFILRPYEEIDKVSFLFQEEWGYEPNGASWQAVIETLVSMHFPKLAAVLNFDAESDECWMTSVDPEPLKAVAGMLRRILLHPEELREALRKTEPD